NFLTKLWRLMLDVKKKIENGENEWNGELYIDIKRDIMKLEHTIARIDPDNWIVSEITLEPGSQDKVIKVELNPLDLSPYCHDIFNKCNKNLLMSAIILDKDTFCTGVGLTPTDVKFIQVDSDFPLE